MFSSRSLLLFSVTILATTSCGSDDPATDPPKAAFSFISDNNFMSPTLISFSNESTGAKEYLWDFGDGHQNSSNINPAHQYAAPGRYSVTLIASNETLVDQVTQVIDIGALPVASFSLESDNFFQAPTTVIFTNTSLHATSYSWDFGDGQQSTEQNPTHKYDATGSYVIELIAKNAFGESTISEEIEVTDNEQSHLERLATEWNLSSATLEGTDRTADFNNLQMTINGQFNGAGGTYAYSFTGSRPNPSPWPASGTWQFDANPVSQIVRLDDGQKISYTLENGDTQLTLTLEFNYQGAGFAGSRIQEVGGNWKFVFVD